MKCDQYWPVRGTETYGMIQVTMLDTVELATYSVRTFALYKVGPPSGALSAYVTGLLGSIFISLCSMSHTLHYITLHYITLHYITLHSLSYVPNPGIMPVAVTSADVSSTGLPSPVPEDLLSCGFSCLP